MREAGAAGAACFPELAVRLVALQSSVLRSQNGGPDHKDHFSVQTQRRARTAEPHRKMNMNALLDYEMIIRAEHT